MGQIKRTSRSIRYVLIMLAGLGLAMALMPADAMAQGGQGQGGTPTCTDDFEEGQQQGIITQVIDYIKAVLERASARLYNGIIMHQNFRHAMHAAFSLFVTLFGVMFIYGIIPLTLGQAMTRLFKIAIMWALMTEGWGFFREYVVRFFNDGTDELIAAVIAIATGGGAGGVGAGAGGHPQPFTRFEAVAGDVLSPHMMTQIIGAMTTAQQGGAMAGLLGLSVGSFIMAIVKALRIYCLSLIAKALLFGMAPIFISFMLFERTKHMFTGWVNQLVNYSLQPLLMFAFLSFYIVMMETSVQNLLQAELCFVSVDTLEGAPFKSKLWRFKGPNGEMDGTDWDFDGSVRCKAEGGDCPEFPIDVVDTLTFLILSHLAWRFADVVLLIATEISSSTLFLDRLAGGLNNVFNRSGKTLGKGNQTPHMTTRPPNVAPPPQRAGPPQG